MSQGLIRGLGLVAALAWGGALLVLLGTLAPQTNLIATIGTIIALAAVHFFIGSLWYSPLMFGNVWARAVGFDPTQPIAKADMAVTMGKAFLCTLGLITSVFMVIALTFTTTPALGAAYGVVVGGGVSLMGLLRTNVFDPKSVAGVPLIHGVYDVVACGVCGALAAWMLPLTLA